jgi:sulfite exporter TauE/SafE/copper chaperone CopZ
MENTSGSTETVRFSIGGMTCVHCQNTIEKALKNTAGVRDAAADYNTGEAAVTYDAAITGFNEISAVIENLGYKTLEEKEKNRALQGRFAFQSFAAQNRNILQTAAALVIILALFLLLRTFGTGKLAAAFPLAREGMSYGMLLVIGLLTSVHCAAMCGGINLSQTLRERNAPVEAGSKPLFNAALLLPSLLYNGGRLVSYTAAGVLVGAIGSALTASGRFPGAVQRAAGIFMVITGTNVLGLFPALRRFSPRMPKIFAKITEMKTGRGPLLVGFLNGFMPCGPLQAMQLYALSAGSPVRGGISMFLFCVGTIPLMFALGAAGSVLSGAGGRVFSRRVMRIGAVLVAALGLVMFSDGWSLSGVPGPFDRISFKSGQSGAFIPVIKNGAQIVNSTLQPNRYPAITVQQGIPVRWTINAPPGSINGCNNRMTIREYGIQHTFKQGDNIIEFTPVKTGRFRYSCWMAMIHSTITVVAEGESAEWEPDTTPKPAGFEIPATIALAQTADNVQSVTIRLGDEGFEPAIVIMQRRLPTIWTITVDSIDSGNIVFPAYYAIIEPEQGENQMRLIPREDFEFYAGEFYGYVKVVDDINRVDIEAVKAEVADFETLAYPEAYFESAY